MKQHEIEIEIGPDGKVHAHILGAKGKGCMRYSELLQEIVGRVVEREFTAERYEPDEDVEILPILKNRQ